MGFGHISMYQASVYPGHVSPGQALCPGAMVALRVSGSSSSPSRSWGLGFRMRTQPGVGTESRRKLRSHNGPTAVSWTVPKQSSVQWL